MSWYNVTYTGKYDAKGKKIPDSNITLDDRAKELDVELFGTLSRMYMIYKVYKSGKVVYLRDLRKSNGDDTFWTTYKSRARVFNKYSDAWEVAKELKYPDGVRIGQF